VRLLLFSWESEIMLIDEEMGQIYSCKLHFSKQSVWLEGKKEEGKMQNPMHELLDSAFFFPSSFFSSNQTYP
jgi:hypothetical protein